MKISRKLILKCVLPRKFVLLAAALSFSSATASADEAVYTMTSFVDSYYGAEISAGNYEQAIEKIVTMKNKRTSFFKETNLCVAYTKTGKLDDAALACDAAVELADSASVHRPVHFTKAFQNRARSSYRALALANRGVLHAVTGDADLAREDFVEALNNKANKKIVQINLARLSEVETKEV